MEYVHESETHVSGSNTPSANRRMVALLSLLLAGLYAVTSSPEMPASIDTQTNALAAHTLAKTGSPFIADYASIVAVPETAGHATWVVESSRGPVSLYPPGAAVVAVPLYVFADDELNEVRDLSPPYPPGTGKLLLPDMWPAAATAVVVAAGALGLFGTTLVDLGLERRIVSAGMIALGLGTGVWSVAADSIWQHGPAILLIGLAMRGLSRHGSLKWLFLASLLLPLVRPPVIAIPVLGSAGASVARRDWRPIGASLGGSAVGLLGFGLYNQYVFGRFSFSGGYGAGISDVHTVASPELGFLVRNLWSAGFASDRGVFIWSPFLLVLALAVPFVARQTPLWVRTMALGAVLYTLYQFLVRQYGGGFDFAFYRYPIEPIFGSAPLGAFGAKYLMERRNNVVDMVLRLAIGLSIVAHAYAAWHF